MIPLSIGFSPCPNDTFIFNRLVHSSPLEGEPVFGSPYLEDVETLNQWAFEQRLDITKLSCHAAGHVLDDYCLLPSGGALGHGCGPLLVARHNCPAAELVGKKIAIPGEFTTAAMLFRMFLPDCTDLVVMRFEQIMEAVSTGEVSAGVIIHESRFTYQDKGLCCLQDLGQWWEESSGMPIPLGCIGVRRSLGRALIADIDRQVKASLDWARKNYEEGFPYIREHAQETEMKVIRSHINLYVNDFSYDLGVDGRMAVETFFSRARQEKILPESAQPVFCL
ncbi:MAG: 1,4-dihydroxy-6-naphthoate synthase [Desulfocapsaceae bacterium]|nr:1,4-dihydroxy-6-naphthoate synthase [Desulfocapsaceae bacterium]